MNCESLNCKEDVRRQQEAHIRHEDQSQQNEHYKHQYDVEKTAGTALDKTSHIKAATGHINSCL